MKLSLLNDRNPFCPVIRTVTREGFSDEKDAQIGDPDHSEVSICAEWIEKFACVSKQARANSYESKGMVERWAGEYVSNGAFIQAAVCLGYKPRHIQGRNCMFRMNPSMKGVRFLDYDWHCGAARVRPAVTPLAMALRGFVR